MLHQTLPLHYIQGTQTLVGNDNNSNDDNDNNDDNFKDHGL